MRGMWLLTCWYRKRLKRGLVGTRCSKKTPRSLSIDSVGQFHFTSSRNLKPMSQKIRLSKLMSMWQNMILLAILYIIIVPCWFTVINCRKILPSNQTPFCINTGGQVALHPCYQKLVCSGSWRKQPGWKSKSGMGQLHQAETPDQPSRVPWL